jgi:DNA-binding PadR family transcriptional regulator
MYKLTAQGEEHLREIERRIPKKIQKIVERAILDQMTWLEQQQYLLTHESD